MANVLQDGDDLNSTTAGSTGTPTTVNASASGGTTSLSPTGSTSAMPKVSQQQIGQLNQGFDFSPLMDTVKQQGTAAKNAIDTAQNNFTTALGDKPVFGADQQNTLNQVLGGQQPLSTGQSLLNKQYNGPSAINPSSYNPLIQKYSTSANELGSDSGFSTLEGSLAPRLTPGERSFDATVFGLNPKYQQATRDTINDANTLMGQGNQAVVDSQNAITQRQNDINAFNQAAQGYVASQRDAINQALSNQMQAANQYDLGVQNELAALRNGTLNLNQIGRNDLTFDPNAFQPQTFQSAMQTVPASVPNLGSSGGWSMRPFQTAPFSDGSTEQVITDPAGNTFYQAYDRNGNIVATYDAAGNPVQGIDLDVLNSMATASKAPVTGSAGFNETVNPNQFLTYNMGQLPTRENVATQDQVTRYNNAEALLGLTDLLGAAQPRQNASLGIDSAALQQALAKAQSDRNAADAAWLAANTPAPVVMQPISPAPAVRPYMAEYEGGQ